MANASMRNETDRREWSVSCPTCKAAAGVPCTRRVFRDGRAYHLTRADKAARAEQRRRRKAAEARERQERLAERMREAEEDHRLGLQRALDELAHLSILKGFEWDTTDREQARRGDAEWGPQPRPAADG
jgi:hypothetical protein